MHFDRRLIIASHHRPRIARPRPARSTCLRRLGPPAHHPSSSRQSSPQPPAPPPSPRRASSRPPIIAYRRHRQSSPRPGRAIAISSRPSPASSSSPIALAIAFTPIVIISHRLSRPPIDRHRQSSLSRHHHRTCANRIVAPSPPPSPIIIISPIASPPNPIVNHHHLATIASGAHIIALSPSHPSQPIAAQSSSPLAQSSSHRPANHHQISPSPAPPTIIANHPIIARPIIANRTTHSSPRPSSIIIAHRTIIIIIIPVIAYQSPSAHSALSPIARIAHHRHRLSSSSSPIIIARRPPVIAWHLKSRQSSPARSPTIALAAHRSLDRRHHHHHRSSPARAWHHHRLVARP